MNKYLWSPSKNTFIPVALVDDYIAAGWDLPEFVEVDDSVFVEFSGVPPEGKVRGGESMPEWVDVPPLTQDELIVQAVQQKSQLSAAVNSEISWRQDAVDADIATEDETTELTAWKKYRVLLMRVDTSTAPDITWPEKPA